jgi:GTP cyclohydrolase I
MAVVIQPMTSDNTPETQQAPQQAQGAYTLPDIQIMPDARGIDLQRVGVKSVDLPLQVLQKDGRTQQVHAQASLSVGLDKSAKGTHMSRMILHLAEWAKTTVFTLELRPFLETSKQILNAPSAEVAVDFHYFIEKPAPVSKIPGPMAYHCRFVGRLDHTDTYNLTLGIVIPLTTLCPCSKAISKYGAHNQRAILNCDVAIDTTSEHRVVWIEDLITKIEDLSSCPLYPVLKRVDEKYVTERAYENPKFVEDVVRDVTLFLRDYPGIKGFALHLEALESIHDHNAWTSHVEGDRVLTP